MYDYISIPQKDGRIINYHFSFSDYSRSATIFVPDVVIIKAYKVHDHRYDLKCFFYEKKYIYYQESIRSKKELHNVVQTLLKENL